MKWIVATFFLPILSLAQVVPAHSPNDKTELQLTTFLKTEDDGVLPSTTRVMKFIDRLDANPESYAKHQQSFVRQIFVKTHSRFLRAFKPNATFSQLFSNGNYNCLTATALIGTTLQHFGYSFRIFETNHHIFILVNTDRGTTLLETTDPFTGFITDPKIVEEKISAYKSATASKPDSRVIQFEFQTRVFREVTLENITGLLHFNHSVSAYNRKDFEESTRHLEEASKYYQSSRLIEFTDVVLLTIRELQPRDASSLSARLQKLRKASSETLASTKF
ncbi:MAG TPA: hypothetical protein VGD40_04710 [Chryseosolibacter sp.]